MKTSRARFDHKSTQSFALVVLTVLAFGPGKLARAQEATRDTNHNIRSAQISPELPRYRFALKPDISSENSVGDFPRVGRIDVFKGDSEAVLQSIDVTSTHWSWLTNSFRTVDINMDGYQDLSVVYQVGGKWGRHNYWLFDPGSSLFATNALTSALRELSHNGLKLNPEKKEIRISHFIGICLNSFDIYRIEKGRLTLLESEFHMPIRWGRCTVEKRKRVNGEMVLIESKEREHEMPPRAQKP